MITSKIIKNFNGRRYNEATSIVKTLCNNGHKAFLVGGCLRDALIGYKKLQEYEYDIATSAPPEDIQKIFPKNIPIGRQFGVILVRCTDGEFEVATFRKENKYMDGRHPSEVKYSKSEVEDVLRRDFTINGMLYDPMKNELHDYVEGEKDLREKIIRTIGDPELRFGEDKLRMIRATRFAAGLSFTIEEKTFKAIKKLSGDINEVSKERIRDELLQIITQRNPGYGIKLLEKTGLLKHILPEVSNMIGVEQPPQFHPEGDVFTHTCIVLDKLSKITEGKYSPETAMGALLHDVGKPPTFEVTDRIRFNGHDRVGAAMAKKICKRLRFSKKQIDQITSLINEHLKFKDVTKMKESTLKKFISIPNFDNHLIMHLADCLGSHGIRDAYDFIKHKLENFQEEDIKPTPLINGNDLINCGLKPGPLFSRILNKIEEQQLEGKLKDKEAALNFVKTNFNS